MVDGMMINILPTAMLPSITRALAFCMLSVVVSPLNAAGLPDPTRPPAFIMGAVSIPASKGIAASSSKGLKSTIISGPRRAAIIDGVTVELWAKHGNAQLIEVNEGSVVLLAGKKRRVLTLFPNVKIIQKRY